MLVVNSLTDKRIFENKFNLVVADLDYTLTNFGQGHQQGVKELARELGKDLTIKFNDIFFLIHQEHVLVTDRNWSRKKEFDQTISQMKSLYYLKSKYGFRKYSRELFIITAAKMLNKEVVKVEIEKGRDAYWHGVANHSPIYPDAKKFLEKINKNNTSLIIMTGSDSVMKVSQNLSLEYIPELSKRYKAKRVERCGIKYQSLIIGDPIDKPDERFFDLVEKEIKKLGSFHKKNILFFGDSYRADLKVPEKRGYKTVLIKRL